MAVVRVAYDIVVPDGKEEETLKVLNAEREQGVRHFLKSHIVDEAEVNPVKVIGREAHVHQTRGNCDDYCYRLYYSSRDYLPEWEN